MTFAIIGLGRSGLAAQRFLLREGASAEEIITFDQKDPSAQISDPKKLSHLKSGDVFVVSPGVPLSLPWIREAKSRGVKVTSEIGLAAPFLGTEKVIGITGSVAKSTTVALLGEGAKSFDPHCFVGGNFGFPLCDYVCDVLSGLRRPAKWIILELSSFQLENCDPLEVDLAAITSLTANHLERYESKEQYYQTKWSLFDRCRGFCFVNGLGGDLQKSSSPKNVARVFPSDPSLQEFQLTDAKLLGAHNQQNLALAAQIAMSAGWPRTSIDAMKSFRGLPHRFENLGRKDGILFINDSKATAIESVLSAILASASLVKQGETLHLLLGGKDKNLPWEELHLLQKNSALKFYFFGECGPLAQKQSRLQGEVFAKMAEAVSAAIKKSVVGDIILLSPGGTSFDEFKNFEDRGEAFVRQITR